MTGGGTVHELPQQDFAMDLAVPPGPGAGMFARQVVIDLNDDCDAVAARLRSRLRGPIGWGSELMLPVVKVGSGPPDFIGRVEEHRVTLHALWRPNMAFGQRSLLGVDGLLVARDGGCQLQARIAPRPLMLAMLFPGAAMLLVGLVVRSTPFLVVAAGGIIYWVVVLTKDLALTERGLRAVVASSGTDQSQARS